MKPDQQIPRNALVWIIVSLFTLVAPHLERIPLWVLAVYVFAALWRIMVYRGRWSFPGRWVKAGLIVGSFAGIYFSFGSVIGLEPTVALLLPDEHAVWHGYVTVLAGLIWLVSVGHFLAIWKSPKLKVPA